MNNELIKVNEGLENTINTREVVAMMETPHADILKKLEGTNKADGTVKQVGIIPTLANNEIDVGEYFIKDTYKDAKGEIRKQYLCTIRGIKSILDGTRNYRNKKTLYEWYYKNTNQDVSPILCDREEVYFVKELQDVLMPFNIFGIPQYGVLNYRIDLYIEDLNIAIEYDEGGHKNYTYESEELRQKLIEKKLGCKFIRVSNNKTIGENIGIIVKKIIKEVA